MADKIKKLDKEIRVIKEFLDYSIKSNGYINKFQLLIRLKDYRKKRVKEII